MVDFGQRLKTLRIHANISQKVLAERLGISKSSVSSYESGFRLPSYHILMRIARIFNVSTDYLLGMDKRYDIDLSGLTLEETDAIRELIQAIQTRYDNGEQYD